MDKIRWTLEDVLAFLEEKIINESATISENKLYENYQWKNKIDKRSHTYKNLIKQMTREYWGE